MDSVKSKRNKTIDFPLEEGGQYLARALRVAAPSSLSEIENKLIFGDCFETLPLLPPASVDLLIADPPYNLDKDFGDSRFAAMSQKDYEAYTVSWIEAVLPLLRPTASVYVCCDWRSGMVIGSVLTRYFHLRNRITWQREKGRGATKNWKNSMEDIWFATCTKDYTFNLEAVKQRRRVLAPYRENGAPKDWEAEENGNFRNTCPSNFWDDISVPFWSMPENTAHPTQKPEKLLAKLILASSNAGDLVFDPFAGSGSTLVTAKKLSRRFCGIEQNGQYCAVGQKPLELAV